MGVPQRQFCTGTDEASTRHRVGKQLWRIQRRCGYLGVLPDEAARWQLVFSQRPISSLHPFPLSLLHLWHFYSIPLRVKSCLEQIHLQDFPVHIVTDLSVYTISCQPVFLQTTFQSSTCFLRPRSRNQTGKDRSRACLPAPRPLKKPNFPPSSSRPMMQSLKKSRKAL